MPLKSPGRSRQELGTPARDERTWDGSPRVTGWAGSCKGKMNTDQGSGRKVGSQGSPHLLWPCPLTSAPNPARGPPPLEQPLPAGPSFYPFQQRPTDRPTVSLRKVLQPSFPPPGDTSPWRDAMLPPSPHPLRSQPFGHKLLRGQPRAHSCLLTYPSQLLDSHVTGPRVTIPPPCHPFGSQGVTSNLCCELSTLICSPDLIPGGQAPSVALSQT